MLRWSENIRVIGRLGGGLKLPKNYKKKRKRRRLACKAVYKEKSRDWKGGEAPGGKKKGGYRVTYWEGRGFS